MHVDEAAAETNVRIIHFHIILLEIVLLCRRNVVVHPHQSVQVHHHQTPRAGLCWRQINLHCTTY